MNTTQLNQRRARLLPGGIPKYIRAYDNGGATADRYTIVYTGCRAEGLYLAASASSFHPQGIGQHGDSGRTGPRRIDTNKWGFAPALGRKNHLGTRIPFAALSADCQKLVLRDYREIWKLDAPTLSIK